MPLMYLIVFDCFDGFLTRFVFGLTTTDQVVASHASDVPLYLER